MWAVNNALCIQTGSEAKPNQRETNNTLTGCMTIRLRSDFPETLSFGLRQSTESFGLTKPLAQCQLCQSNWKRRVWWNSDCIWLCTCLPFLLSCKGQIPAGVPQYGRCFSVFKAVHSCPGSWKTLHLLFPGSIFSEGSIFSDTRLQHIVSKQRQTQKKGLDHTSAVTMTYMHCLNLKKHTTLPSPPSEGLWGQRAANIWREEKELQ